jgi:DnaJ domain
MLPPRRRFDPNGYYARLGLDPAAPQASVAAAYRAKARLLHPDVPKTGNAEAFVAVKQAYDVLSNPGRRQEYDRSARDEAAQDKAAKSEAGAVRRAFYHPVSDLLVRPPPLSGATVAVLVGLAAFLCLSVYEVATHLMTSTPVVNAGIRPNAATVEPLSPSEHRAVLYGPAPVRLAGIPNFYVVPAGSPAVLWQLGPNRDTLVSLGQLPPFSSVQAVRLVRQSGMLEVLVDNRGNGFVSADHLTPGDARAARSAYCSYNSGPIPFNGELLEQRGAGTGILALENRAVQPAVVKLRDQTGAVVAAVFLGPGGQADLGALPEGRYRAEFAIGELWSRACNLFAAGMRARRIDGEIRLPGTPRIVIASDGGAPAGSDISDQAFERE